MTGVVYKFVVSKAGRACVATDPFHQENIS